MKTVKLPPQSSKLDLSKQMLKHLTVRSGVRAGAACGFTNGSRLK